MGTIVSYDPYSKKFTFHHDSKWIETLWATIYASNISSTSKIVFATMMSYVYQEPLEFPTQQVLSDAVQKNRRTIMRAIEELCEKNLLEIPAGLNSRRNKYIIHDHSTSSLKFSGQAENLLNTLLDVQVSDFNVISAMAICDENTTRDKNVTNQQKEKREEEKEEKKVIQRKEEREEEKKEKLEPHGSSDKAYNSSLSEKDQKLARLSTGSTLKHSSKYGYMEDEKRSLTEAMKEPKPKRERPKDVHSWETVDFETYFKHRYHELSGKKLNINFAKERKLIKNMLERTSDIEEIRDVIDFVFDNWKAIAKKNDFQQFPTISLVFSQWFGTFQAMMHAGKPKSKHFIDRRSDYDYSMPKGLVRRPGDARKSVNQG